MNPIFIFVCASFITASIVIIAIRLISIADSYRKIASELGAIAHNLGHIRDELEAVNVKRELKSSLDIIESAKRALDDDD